MNLKALAAPAALLLAACAVGPDFKSPAAPAADRYTATPLPAQTTSSNGPAGGTQRFTPGSAVPSRWWTTFGSSRLDSLVDQAFSGSPTIDAAKATLRQSQEQYKVVHAGLFPSIDGNASATREKVSGASYDGPPNIFTLYDASLSLSYGIDLFGGIRREQEQQQALVDYQRFELQAAYQTLAANVVTTAISEASLDAQVDATTAIIGDLHRQLDITEKQEQLGGVSTNDVLVARSNLASEEATLPALRKQAAQTRHLLATYLGKLPSDFSGSGLSLDALILPADLPVSLPSALVRQRPDVRAAEEQMHQASAAVGIATIAMLPQLSINANFGDESSTPGDLFTNGIWGLGANLAQPLFQGGALNAKKHAAEDAYDIAAAQYRSIVLHAFEEVADALRALETDADALEAQSRAATTAEAALQIAEKQQTVGGISFLQLLNAQHQYQQARIGWLQAQASRYQDTAALFQALGGGVLDEAAPAASATATR